MRRLIAFGLICASFLVVARAGAYVSSIARPIIAIIDSGIRPTHQEFYYQSASSDSDQIVGWWNFTRHLPGPGEVWDTKETDPSDPCGHGTATASLAAGLNVSTEKDRSYAPGYRLAIAKVLADDCGLTGDTAAAIRWAVDEIRASVISISLGYYQPWPALLDEGFLEAIAFARSKGVMVVVLNANGWRNSEIPGNPGWAVPPGASTNALSVGASGSFAYVVNTDPEVTAKYAGVGIASNWCDTCYVTGRGTSFSTPVVAGMAARLISEAMDKGRNRTPDHIETLLKYSARDTQTPPTFEGYGVLDNAAFPAALAHAAEGTVPSRPVLDVNALYVERVSGSLRLVWAALGIL